ncbi:hypothetical protein H0G86_005295 [Trichoderma simmonsii]|uniref:Uncharacterized protein n=1 Tax=Trichoderma simmonsii TaxID=1491479 RepID=A0A8G0PCY0_9HYPO|nr:hypothetical protein H0G86_005295 [Trichoderma simmonsii]
MLLQKVFAFDFFCRYQLPATYNHSNNVCVFIPAIAIGEFGWLLLSGTHPNIQHPDRLFPFIPGTSLYLVLVKLAFCFSRPPTSIPSIPPQPTKGIDFGKHEIYPLPFFLFSFSVLCKLIYGLH